MELMVAMVLFVTVISLGMLLWSNVNSGLRKIQNDSDVFYEYISLVNLLDKDINQAIKINSSGIKFELFNDIEDISYFFYPDSVIRLVNSTSSKFHLKTLNYELNYYKTTDIINGIKLQFNLQGKNTNCFLYKSIEGRSIIKTQLEDGN
jgi:hypothetical protein